MAFLTSVSEKRKSASPSAVQVKNRRTTVDTEEKLEVISRFEKGERIVDIYRNVRLAHSSVRTVPVITVSAKSGTTVFV